MPVNCPEGPLTDGVTSTLAAPTRIGSAACAAMPKNKNATIKIAASWRIGNHPLAMIDANGLSP
jgi:hypothetical protein